MRICLDIVLCSLTAGAAYAGQNTAQRVGTIEQVLSSSLSRRIACYSQLYEVHLTAHEGCDALVHRCMCCECEWWTSSGRSI